MPLSSRFIPGFCFAFPAALALLSVACGDATSPTAPTSSITQSTSAATTVGTGTIAAQSAEKLPDDCTFDRGTTTCVTTTTRMETETIAMVSGCLYGPDRQAGRRTRTTETTYRVTDTTTTRQHGRNGAVYDTQTASSREFVSSRFVSDVCEPI
jgi:hypothetical protein